MRLHSLKKRDDLNGRQGTLIRYFEKRGRWAVEFEGEETPVMLLESNLELFSDVALVEEVTQPDGAEVTAEAAVARVEDDGAAKLAAVENGGCQGSHGGGGGTDERIKAELLVRVRCGVQCLVEGVGGMNCLLRSTPVCACRRRCTPFSGSIP